MSWWTRRPLKGSFFFYLCVCFVCFFLSFLSGPVVPSEPRDKKVKTLLDLLSLSCGGRRILSETNSLRLKRSEFRSAFLKLIQEDLQPGVPGPIQRAQMMSAGRWCWAPADEWMLVSMSHKDSQLSYFSSYQKCITAAGSVSRGFRFSRAT